MRVNIRPHSHFTNDTNFLAVHGDTIWEDLCDTIWQEGPFTLSSILPNLQSLQPFAPSQRPRYLRLITHNSLLDPYPALIRVSRNFYRWA